MDSHPQNQQKTIADRNSIISHNRKNIAVPRSSLYSPFKACMHELEKQLTNLQESFVVGIDS